MSLFRSIFFGLLGLSLFHAASGFVSADETEKRRVDISVSIFPRIVAVDNHFRDKLDANNKASLLFVYDSDKKFAQQLAERIGGEDNNIGGMSISTRILSAAEAFPDDNVPVAIFLVEKLSDAQLLKVLSYAESAQRLVLLCLFF